LGNNWRRFKIASKIIWITLGIITLFVSVRLNFVNHTETRELAVYVQTPLSFQKVINKIDKDCRLSSDKNCVLIDQKISWPMSWLFKDYGTLIFADNFEPQLSTKYIFLDPSSTQNTNTIKGWKKNNVMLRDWWVPEPCRKISCLPKYFSYFFTRKVWNEKGGFEATLMTP